jgi:ribosomal protein L17
VENNSKEQREVIIRDNFPVSNSKEIEVAIKNLSTQFVSDEDIKKTTEYQQGIRKFIINLSPGAKKEITYDAVITYDKQLIIDWP